MDTAADQTVAVVLSGGDGVDATDVAPLPDDALVVAADSGLHLADALGLAVDVVIGDMDSVDPARLEAAEQRGAQVRRHPVDKDATDLELALAFVAGRRATRSVLVVGGSGGRLDHLLATAALLTDVRYAHVRLEWRTGRATVHVLHGGRRVEANGAPNDLLSLIPFGSDAVGVTTRGLAWTLEGETLRAGTTRGVSNRLTETDPTITLDEGTLLVVHERNDTCD